jgi:type IV secretion system protein VirD4
MQVSRRWKTRLVWFVVAVTFLNWVRGSSGVAFRYIVWVVVGLWIFLELRSIKKPVEGLYNAHWANYGELSKANMIVTSNERGNAPMTTPMVLVGAISKNNGPFEPLAVKPGHAGRSELGNFLTVGPPGSGKGRAITANLTTYPESVVVLDVKGENFEATAGRRSKFSRVLVLHPEGRGNQYDPTLHMRHSDEALKTVANTIIDSTQDKEPAFAQAAENALYAALLAARFENAPTFPYLQALLDMGILGFVQYLAKLDDKKIQSALIRFTTVKPEEFDADFFSRNGLVRGAWGILNTRCAEFMTDGVMAMLGGNDFAPSDLYGQEQPVSLYLVFPEAQMSATAKAFSLVVMSLMMGMTEYYDKATNKPSRQVLLMLDEAGRVKFPDLANYLATIRSRNIVASLYIQDLSQLEVVYERDRAQAILAQCKTQIFHASTHEGTQGYVSRASGLISVIRSDYVTLDDAMLGYESKLDEQHRPLLTPDEVRQLHPDSVIIFSANVPPIYAYRVDPSMVWQGITRPAAPALKTLGCEPMTLEPPATAKVRDETKPAAIPKKIETAVEPEF